MNWYLGEASFKSIIKFSRVSDTYIYELYKEWENIFEYESVRNKYFNKKKLLVDNTLPYFINSIILSVYNLLILKNIILFIILFLTISLLTIIVNKRKNVLDESKSEYYNWLKFKNSFKKKDISNLDILTNYSLYAYTLDEKKNFILHLNKMYDNNNKVYDDNIILGLLN